jgi:hypothetical protein
MNADGVLTAVCVVTLGLCVNKERMQYVKSLLFLDNIDLHLL